MKTRHRMLGAALLVGSVALALSACVVTPGYVAPVPVVVAPAPVVVAPAPVVVYGRPHRRGW